MSVGANLAVALQRNRELTIELYTMRNESPPDDSGCSLCPSTGALLASQFPRPRNLRSLSPSAQLKSTGRLCAHRAVRAYTYYMLTCPSAVCAGACIRFSSSLSLGIDQRPGKSTRSSQVWTACTPAYPSAPRVAGSSLREMSIMAASPGVCNARALESAGQGTARESHPLSGRCCQGPLGAASLVLITHIAS